MSNPFGESPYWQDFWQNRSIEKNVALYALAPFLQEAAGLLHAATQLWHPWSLKRKEEMTLLARSLAGDASTLRQRGLVWACQSPHLSKDPRYVFGNFVFSRRYGSSEDKKYSVHPEATAHLVSAAVQMLFMLLGAFEKISQKDYEHRHWIPKLSVIIETLMESPYIGTKPIVSNEMMHTIAMRGVLTECEGLAHIMARIEDRFNQKNKTSKRKKSTRTDAELSALAAEIGVDFETLKDVFETEYSSWWKISTAYKEKAEACTASFLIHHLEGKELKTAIRDAWDAGRPDADHLSEYFSEDEMGAAENIIKAFISMFLANVKEESEHTSTIGGETKPLLTLV